jgi:hypothetical protein
MTFSLPGDMLETLSGAYTYLANFSVFLLELPVARKEGF